MVLWLSVMFNDISILGKSGIDKRDFMSQSSRISILYTIHLRVSWLFSENEANVEFIELAYIPHHGV